MTDLHKINNNTTRRPKVLVAPLDWGLGHATRCIPIINKILDRGWEVIIATEGAQKNLLQAEFPGLAFTKLSGYGVNYGSDGRETAWKIGLQAPKILMQINREKKWLKAFLTREKIDAVIADNRYGLHSLRVPTVFITHQLQIITPFGKKPPRWLKKLNYRFIEQFSRCWVPDYPGEKNLAGILSHPGKLPAIPTRYIGALTRLETETAAFVANSILIILSGPEPQRSILEKKILGEAGLFEGPVSLIRGLPGEKRPITPNPSLRVFNHLTAGELSREVNAAEWVIARSGYTTVMDTLLLNKKTILIPTPGQPEQEYLGRYLMEKKWAFAADQENFTLKHVIEQAKQFQYQPFDWTGEDLLEMAIGELELLISA